MLKEIKIGVNIAKAKILNQRKPLSVTICVTNKCNLRCSYCTIPERIGKELTTDQMFRLIDELACSGVQRLGFVGGEPLLRKDIDLLIKRARQKNLFVSVTTNGTLIKQKLAALKNLDIVLVSIDGPQCVHDLTGKENVKALLEGIDR